MTVLHSGTATTLATIPTADISNGDVAYIWLNSYSRKMVYDATSTKAEDTSGHPYYIRPDDYSAAGVWVEDVGADQPEAWNGAQIRTGSIESTNWIDGTSGTKLDLDNELIAIKDDSFASAGIQIGWLSGVPKLYFGDGSNKFLKYDGSDLTWKATNSELDASGNIVCTGGTIGGFTLAATTLTATNLILDSANQRITLGSGNDIIILDADDADYRVWVGNATAASATFRVSKAGVLTATGASISGAITGSTIDIGGADATSFHVDVDGNMWLGAASYNIATNPFAVSNAGVLRAASGTIGGLTLSDSALYTGSKTAYDDANAGVHFGTDGIGIGNNVFTVSSAGALVAKSATIGNWSVNTTSIYTGTEDHSAYTANAGDITLYSDGSNASIHAKNFYIDASGNLTCTSATISGAITATSGSITGSFTIGSSLVINSSGAIYSTGKTSYADTDAGFFLGYDTDAYKLNIGDASSYIKWSGSAFSVKMASDETFTLDGSLSLSVGADIILTSQTGSADGDRAVLQFNLNSYNIKIAGDYDGNRMIFTPSTTNTGSISFGYSVSVGGIVPFYSIGGYADYITFTSGNPATLYNAHISTEKSASDRFQAYCYAWAGSYVAGMHAYVDESDTQAYTELFGDIILTTGHYIGLDNAASKARIYFDDAATDTISFWSCAVGIGVIPYSACMLDVKGAGTTSGTYGIIARDSGGNNCFYTRDDKYVWTGGDVYITDDCSAASFTDRSSFFDGDAITELAKIKGDIDGKLDHNTLPAFAKKDVTNYTQDGILIKEPGRDLGAMVSMLTTAIKQLSDEVTLIKHQLNAGRQ